MLPSSWRDLMVHEPLSGGVRNEVYAASLGGRRVVVHRSRRDKASLRWELDLLVDLDAAGFRVPRPIPSDDGRLAVDGWTVRTWIDGRAPSSKDDWRLVADELRRLHRFGRDRAQRPGACSVMELAVNRRSLDADVDAMAPEDAHDVVTALDRYLEAQVTVIHGDPGPSNLRVDDDGRVGMIDWDESRVDVADLDLGSLPIPVLGGRRRAVAEAAADAWEAMNGWSLEPQYAAARLASLRRRRLSGWSVPELNDGVVSLRVRTASDVDAHLAGEDDEFARWLSGGLPSRQRATEHIERCAQLWANGGLRLSWGIYLVATGELVGTIEANFADLDLELDEVNVSYGLFRHARAMGLASRALRLAVGHLATLGEARQAVVKIAPDNQRSIAVAERGAFTPTDRTFDKRGERLLAFVHRLT